MKKGKETVKHLTNGEVFEMVRYGHIAGNFSFLNVRGERRTWVMSVGTVPAYVGIAQRNAS